MARRKTPILSIAVLALYPLGIYLVARAPDTSRISLAGACACAIAITGFRFAGGGTDRFRTAAPGLVFVLAIAGLLIGQTGPALAVPVVVNAVLFWTFVLSLSRGQTIVERFARTSSPTLDAAQIRYCRSVTVAWCVFFLLNGATAAVLAVFAPLAWWAAFTGAISYVLVGLVFAVEYSIRSVRFPASAGPLGIRIAALVACVARTIP